MKKPSLEQSYTLSQEPDGYVIINGVKYVKEEPKEETFVISRGFLRAICQEIELNQKSAINWIKEKYPSAFVEDKKELVAGKWYKYPDYQKWNLYITEVDEKTKTVKGYGFGADGLWMDNTKNDIWYFKELELCIEMTQEEVEEALKAEAGRLKYKENLKHVECLCGFNKETSQEYYSDNKSIFYYEKHVNKLWVQDGSYLDICIFDSGKWAEIIHPKKMTQAEIEKELGYLINIVD